MKLLLILCSIIIGVSSRKISKAPEIYRNELRFPYGTNFKFNGILQHNLDRVWIVTKIPIPKFKDIPFSKVDFDPACKHIEEENFRASEDRKTRIVLIKQCGLMRTRYEMIKDKE